MTKFRLSAKTIILTYAQSGLVTRDALYEFLSAKRPKYLVVSAEKHATGDPHLHAVISFADKLDIRKADYFDFQGLHPNMQGARKPRDAINYVKKDGDFVEDGDPPFKRGWGEIASCRDKHSFMMTVKDLYPRDYVLCYDRLISYAEAHFTLDKGPYEDPYEDNWDIPMALDDWFETEFKVNYPL